MREVAKIVLTYLTKFTRYECMQNRVKFKAKFNPALNPTNRH